MSRKRIALSIDPEYHELLTRLAEYQKKTVTGVVTDFFRGIKTGCRSYVNCFSRIGKRR